MRVLLVTNGTRPKTSPRTLIRQFLPNFADRLKNTAALGIPKPMLAWLLRGFSLERRFPVGIGYLSAMLKQEGMEVELVDRFVLPDSWARRPIREYDFVGVHVSTPYFQDSLDILARLDQEGYSGPVAFGGPHTTLQPETIPPQVDYVVQGEAEYLIADLVDGHYPRGSLIRAPRIKSLDALPRPDFELFMPHLDAYDLTTPYSNHAPYYNVHTSRSCPFACTFCAVRDIWGRLWVAHSAERVVEDIAWLMTDYGARGIYFREDYFVTQRDRVAELCERILRKNLKLAWACETRVDIGAEPELVSLMARAGCKGFYIGAESGSDRMLEKYNKEATSSDIYRCCDLARRHGINVAMSIIVADPDERPADRLATWRMVRKTQPALLQLSAFNGDHTGLNEQSLTTYPPRQVIEPDLPNSTTSGQSDRAWPRMPEADLIAAGAG